MDRSVDTNETQVLQNVRIYIRVYKGSFPCAQLAKHYAMKTWVSGGIAPPFFTWALNGGEW
jgi:hypothetical protein